MELEWKDETSYSYAKGGRRGEVEPSVLAVYSDGIRIIVHRHIHMDGWLLSIYDLDIKQQPLGDIPIHEAKIKALATVHHILIDKIKQYQKMKKDMVDTLIEMGEENEEVRGEHS